jgi:hypothetical protein
MARPPSQLRVIDGTLADERIVKPELNLEQWPLFIPSQARGRKQQPRTIERSELLPDGNTITTSVTVGFCEHGILTAKDQRVLYALVQNWNEKGCPLNYCYFSVYRLLQLLRMNDSGANIETTIDSLRRLGGVAITFKSCFHNAETGEEYEDEEPIHILSELRIRKRKRAKDGKYEATKAEGYFLFHSRILKNLIRNYTRPVLFNVVLSLTTDTAQLLYTLVDRQLATKDTYTKATAALFQEIGLEGKDYHKPSARKRAIEKPLTELVGKLLSSGGIIGVAEIEHTKDKTDYKVVFKRRAAIRALPAAKKAEEPSEAEQLVNYFQQVFFGVSGRVKAGKRELEQAAKLIVAHGFDTAKTVIDCAKREAPKTSFEIKTFGGVMQYQAKALADVEAARVGEERRRKHAEEQERARAQETYFQFFAPAYRAHQCRELQTIREMEPESYAAFASWLNKNHARTLRMVTSEKRREELTASKAAEFFNELRPELSVRLTAFAEWDEEHNGERLDPIEWFNRDPQGILDELEQRLSVRD